MRKAISLDQLPPKLERLLRAAWEEQESVVLERNGEPVAAVVPMADYQRLHPEPARLAVQRRVLKRDGQKNNERPPEWAAQMRQSLAEVSEYLQRVDDDEVRRVIIDYRDQRHRKGKTRR
jgi:prevent-host-death family protein